jgi:hypothetical protein
MARNAACTTIVGLVDQSSGSGPALYPTGHLSLYGTDGTRVTWHVLSNPAFGTSSDGTSLANLISDATAVRDSTASTFSFDNRDGTVVWRGDVTVNGGGGSLQLESVIIPMDTTVAITGARYIVPA